MKVDIKDTELSWAAGLLEGEGSFSLVPSHGSAILKITCAMSDLDTIERLARILGGNVYSLTQRGNYKPMWSWSVQRRDVVVPLLRILQPMMGLRRQAKIEELLTWHATNPITRNIPWIHGTLTGYRAKCRCEPCREAEKVYKQKLRTRRSVACEG